MTWPRGVAWVGLVAAVAAFTGAVLTALAARAGTVGLLAPLILLAVALLALRPKVALALAVVSVALLESDGQGFLGFTARFYEGLGGRPLRPHELLLVITAIGVLVERARSRRPLHAPDHFTFPLLLLLPALAAGLVTGLFSDGQRGEVASVVPRLLTLVAVPFLVVNLIEDRRDLLGALGLAGAVVALKTAVGGVGWLLGAGRAIEGTVLTYYAPLPNFLLLLFTLSVAAAALDRTRLPAWAWWLAPLALIVLALSFRRNFWIAAVLGLLLVVLMAMGSRGRLLLIPGGVLVAAALWLALTALSAAQTTSPLIERAQSLAPSRLQTKADDRYRLDEQRNVLAEIRRRPLTGIGVGVPWSARHPVAKPYREGRMYTHVTVLWYWLKLGLLGVAAYVWLMVAAVRSGLGLWRRAADRTAGAVGLGLAAGFLGLAVAETTGSFTGVEPRITLFVGAALGWLAAAHRLAGERALDGAGEGGPPARRA